MRRRYYFVVEVEFFADGEPSTLDLTRRTGEVEQTIRDALAARSYEHRPNVTIVRAGASAAKSET